MNEINEVPAANEKAAIENKLSELYSCYQIPNREYSDCLKQVVKILNRK